MEVEVVVSGAGVVLVVVLDSVGAGVVVDVEELSSALTYILSLFKAASKASKIKNNLGNLVLILK